MTKGQNTGKIPYIRGHQNKGRSAVHRKKPGGFPEGVQIDDADRERLGGFRWSISGNGYVQRHYVIEPGRYTKIRLHREIMGFPEGAIVDHINGDRLDCRRSNLRLVDDQGNAQNQGTVPANTSGYRGVSWRKKVGRWYAYAKVDGKMISLGFFDDVHEAGQIALEYRKSHYKSFVDR